MALPQLDPVEQRVLGVLLEKQVTVPATYPMTLAAVRTEVRDLPGRHRVYFRTRLPAPAASIRGRVESFDWAPRGSSM